MVCWVLVGRRKKDSWSRTYLHHLGVLWATQSLPRKPDGHDRLWVSQVGLGLCRRHRLNLETRFGWGRTSLFPVVTNIDEMLLVFASKQTIGHFGLIFKVLACRASIGLCRALLPQHCTTADKEHGSREICRGGGGVRDAKGSHDG